MRDLHELKIKGILFLKCLYRVGFSLNLIAANWLVYKPENILKASHVR